MPHKIKWADVVLGKTVTRYSMDDTVVEDIKLDPQTLSLIVFLTNGDIKSYFGCSYAICQEETADIIVPKIEVVS